MKINEKILVLRKRKGLSQEDLANELDVSRQSVYKWENEEAIPEINKIKRMATLFNISFDELLNDEIDITVQPSSVPPKPNIVKKSYREAFYSKKEMDFFQDSLDHGYTKSRTRKNKKSSQIIDGKIANMRSILGKKGIEKGDCVIFANTASCFFQSVKESYFGFFYNGAIQFVCPFENFIHASLSSSNMPETFRLLISYFDKDGIAKEFHFVLNSLQRYKVVEMNTKDFKIETKTMADFYRGQLNGVVEKLKTISVIGARIMQKEIEVNDIDVEALAQEVQILNKKETEMQEQWEKEAIQENKEHKILFYSILGVVALVVGIFIIISYV